MPEKQRKVRDAALAGGIFGVIVGAPIGVSLGNALLGSLLIGLYFALAEAITTHLHQPGQLKPLVHRISGSVLTGAAVGALLALLNFSPLLIGVLMGVAIGLMSLGPRKLVLGIVVGVVVGVLGMSNGVLLGGGIVLVYRLLLLLILRDTEPIKLVGERMDPAAARYIVPFEAQTKYIGTDYMRQLAHTTDGVFERNRTGIGLLDSLDALRGPHLDPARVDARIRDFYEHTSNYKLTIVPEWNRLMRPFFRLFKQSIAQQIGQANLPFDIEEAQRGIVSYIDTVDYSGPEADHIRTLRAWIRAFEATGAAIYVGVYTVVRHEDIGYISVGFPLPESNFTATLLPYNDRGNGLKLTTRDTGVAFTGHYVSDIDNDTGVLTTLKLPTFNEEIEVYLQDGQLKTDHSFFFGDYRFLTLHYHIEPALTGG